MAGESATDCVGPTPRVGNDASQSVTSIDGVATSGMRIAIGYVPDGVATSGDRRVTTMQCHIAGPMIWRNGIANGLPDPDGRSYAVAGGGTN